MVLACHYGQPARGQPCQSTFFPLIGRSDLVYPIGCSGKGLSKQPEGPTTGMGWSHQILLPCQTTKRATFGALSGTGKESAASESRRASSFVARPRQMPLSGMPGRDWSDGMPNVACFCLCNLMLTNPCNPYLDISSRLPQVVTIYGKYASSG